eukprot:11251209-Alexandrium_andersonii.AAC.1
MYARARPRSARMQIHVYRGASGEGRVRERASSIGWSLGVDRRGLKALPTHLSRCMQLQAA